MKLIGLCGKSGSGKSALCGVLRARGVVCIDCDQLTRAVQEPGSDCVRELAAALGSGILLSDGSLDRAKTARLAFGDPEKLELLNRVTHKYVLAALNKELENYRNEPFVVVEAPALFESGLNKQCDYVVGLVSKRGLARIMARDRLSERAAKERLSRQKDEAFLRENCDLILENNASPETLDQLAKTLLCAIDTEVLR